MSKFPTGRKSTGKLPNLRPKKKPKELQGPPVYGIISTTPEFGMSLTKNLAAVYAVKHKDKKVALIDGNFRTGTLGVSLAGVQNPNIINLINDIDQGSTPQSGEEMDQYLIKHQGITNLSVLCAPDNLDAHLDFAKDDLDLVLNLFKQHFDTIFIDLGSSATDTVQMGINKHLTKLVSWVTNMPSSLFLQQKQMKYLGSNKQYPILKKDVHAIMQTRIDSRIVPAQIAKQISTPVFMLGDFENLIAKAESTSEFAAFMSGGTKYQLQLQKFLAEIEQE